MSDFAHFVIWFIGAVSLVVLGAMILFSPYYPTASFDAVLGTWLFIGTMGAAMIIVLVTRLLTGEWPIGSYNDF